MGVAEICACGVTMRRRFNFDYCSPACALVGELMLDIAALELRRRDG